MYKNNTFSPLENQEDANRKVIFFKFLIIQVLQKANKNLKNLKHIQMVDAKFAFGGYEIVNIY